MHIYPQQDATYMTIIACSLNSCRHRNNSEISELLYPETPTYNGQRHQHIIASLTSLSITGCGRMQLGVPN